LPYTGNDVRKRQIICVARIAPVKGIHDLIMAFHIASKRVPGWRLIIVGPIEDRQYYEYLQNLIKKFNLENGVSFTGMVNDEELARIYAESLIFVLPSYHEGFSIARVEALAYGLPVITTETGGSEVVRGCGLVVKPGDVYGLAKALEDLMSNEELRAKLSNLALDRAKSLTWRSIAERIIKIIESL
jgi:glycosyltransferase involved in cell wall biosynthesis